MADLAIGARTSRPACTPAGRTACRAVGRSAGVTVSRPTSRGSGPFGLANPYPDLRSFGFGDEVIEEKAVLLLFEVEVVELNEE